MIKIKQQLSTEQLVFSLEEKFIMLDPSYFSSSPFPSFNKTNPINNWLMHFAPDRFDLCGYFGTCIQHLGTFNPFEVIS